ncbi:MAG: hypothetical protein JOZ01_04385 [Candidatus Eremiobacteraeota bacterium]|nr:hypothetical protein [Candidatus Eremiobacteraeota bacterium]
MSAALFVSNGHGEASIAERIAAEVRTIAPAMHLDHVPLVGDDVAMTNVLACVGPRRAMPSGGLIAMGNLRNIVRDVRAGLLGLTLAQLRFLRSVRGRYDVVAAVGDAFALFMALQTRAPAIFVGTAKSVSVAAYGPFEQRLLRRARMRFVRDDATARRLRERGIATEPAANVIVDLFATGDDPRAQRAVEGFRPAIALFPGSRSEAYDDAEFLLRVVRGLACDEPALGAVLSIAPRLAIDEFAAASRRAGWEVSPCEVDGAIPFTLHGLGQARVRAWRGPLGPILKRVSLVLGQAGTANEAAAAAGVPVVAFEDARRKSMWYRKRQQGLLGDALALFPANVDAAIDGVGALLRDPARRAGMSAAGRMRMGSPGAARRIAERIVTLGASA